MKSTNFRSHFFSRHGGESRGPYASLNVSRSVGDDPLDVACNRARIKDNMGLTHLVSSRQVHGEKVFVVADDPGEDLEVDGYDALITTGQNIGLMVQLADCQGIILHDPVTPAIAAIHCGWRGSVSRIIGNTVDLLVSHYSSDPVRIQAMISPSLGPCCAEFINHRRELPDAFQSYQVKPDYFNFWDISRDQLIQAGLDEGNIEISGICTSCSPDYFSYRRAYREGNGITGRHCALVSL